MIRSTNTQWFNIINYDFFTIYFARPTTIPDLVKTFSRYAKPIGLRFEKTIEINESFILLSSLTNLTSLEIEPNFSIEGRSNSLRGHHVAYFTALTKLQRLDLFQSEVTPYIQHFPKLTTLQIRALDPWDPFKPFNYNKYSEDEKKILSKLSNHVDLRSLIVSDQPGYLEINGESIAKMSKVSHLSFVSSVSHFPFNKLPNLESLSIVGPKLDDLSMHSKLTSLTLAVNWIPEQLASLINLKYLHLTAALTDERLGFICKLTKLEDLAIIGYSRSSGSYLQLINSRKLTSLRVNDSIKSLAYIAHLTNLQQLDCHFQQDQYTGVPLFTLPSVTKLNCLDSLRGTINMEFCPNVKEIVIGNCSGERLNHAIASLVHLEHFKAGTIDESFLGVLSKHTQLTHLEASCWFYGTFDLLSLQNLTSLRIMHLQCSFIEGGNELNELTSALRALTNIEDLLLNQFDEDKIQLLECLPKLKVLAIRRSNDITQASFSNLTNLQSLELPSRPGSMFRQRKTNSDLPYLYKLI